MSHHGTQKRGRTVIVAVAAFAVGALAVSGASLALWNQSAFGEGQTRGGFEHFAAGQVGSVEEAVQGSVSVSVGVAEATELAENGKVAVVFQTDSVSQGNKGLQYTITAPEWGDGLFGTTTPELFPVSSPAECTVTDHPTTGGLPFDAGAAPVASTPVSADYSTTTTPTTEYWCLVAELGQMPDVGSYKNTATATAKDDSGQQVSDTDDWSAVVTTGIDPADEDEHLVTFSYTSFRPGQETP